MGTAVLDGLTLNPNMKWIDRFDSHVVVQTVRQTLGAKPYVEAGSLIAGRFITLEAGDEYGWLTKTQVDILHAKAAVAGAQYVLVYDDVNYTVIFRHQEKPAVEMQPLIPRVTHEAGDYFIGLIKLMTV